MAMNSAITLLIIFIISFPRLRWSNQGIIFNTGGLSEESGIDRLDEIISFEFD